MDKSFIQVKNQSIGKSFSDFTGKERFAPSSRRQGTRSIGDMGRSNMELDIVFIDL